MTTQTIKSTGSKVDDPASLFSLRSWMGKAVKRAFDIVLSGLGLLILSPIFLLIAILVKRDSPGPVFYRGIRLGRGDKPFSILKFRTMHEEAASYAGPPLTAEDDPRITPLGKWLRDTKLNELPQLWNVLVGGMSLVGPRPEEPSLAQAWPLDVRAEVLSVRPGITSPASVLFRDEEKMLSAGRLMDTYLMDILPFKLRLDLLYVRHRSLLLDLDVLFWTFLAVLVYPICVSISRLRKPYSGGRSRAWGGAMSTGSSSIPSQR
jgi:lipopolysaccharide/colanic/teichoic acid biosynthesis glycosyltransferase